MPSTPPAALVHTLTSRGCSSSRHPIALSCGDADKCSRAPEHLICGDEHPGQRPTQGMLPAAAYVLCWTRPAILSKQCDIMSHAPAKDLTCGLGPGPAPMCHPGTAQHLDAIVLLDPTTTSPAGLCSHRPLQAIRLGRWPTCNPELWPEIPMNVGKCITAHLTDAAGPARTRRHQPGHAAVAAELCYPQPAVLQSS